MGNETRGTSNTEAIIEDTVEAIKARVFAALDAMSPGEVRSLVEEIETEVETAGPK